VKFLVNADRDLSTTGIGPKTNGGLPLYAGRWIDPVTGALKVLPKANTKYVNPLSKAQKLKYQ